MSDLATVATVSVPKSKGLHQSGAKKGRLRKGCRFSGRGIKCTPAVASSLGAKGKKVKAKSKRRGNANFRTPKSPQAAQNKMVFDALQSARRGYKRAGGNCQLKTHFAMKIIKSLQYMARLPTSGKSDVNKRNHRYAVEARRVEAETRRGCTSGGEVRRVGPVSTDEQYQNFMRTVPGARVNPRTGRFDGTRR